MTRGRLAGILVIEPSVAPDERGFFLESFQRARYLEAGIDVDFVQDNQSRSAQGTIRGMHYQAGVGQTKLVRVARGAALDVVVDIRLSSPTLGEWEAFELDDVVHRQVYIPPGFAHGFCALSEIVDFAYKVGTYFDAKAECGIAWDDPEVGIRWPIANPIISSRDRRNPSLAEALGIQGARDRM